ncbi:hypothetical protein M0R45_008841 [Rubus argutus]|uniref:MHC class I antigen n=1 Tax=Rubus argutus TaxID=59490 RepID=A0AAW1Y4A0_RUBAR
MAMTERWRCAARGGDGEQVATVLWSCKLGRERRLGAELLHDREMMRSCDDREQLGGGVVAGLQGFDLGM